MKDYSVQSRTIEWLRFFCAVLVVIIHAFRPFEASWKNGIYDIVRILFSQGVCRVAVPIFFFISGYLFFIRLDEWNNRIWIDKLKKRIHTLLLPYLIWNLIAIFLSLFLTANGSAFQGYAIWFKSIGGFRAFWNSSSGSWPIDAPLWFIRNLIILVVLSPIIYFYVKQSRIVGLIVLGVLYVFRWWKEVPGFEIAGIIFFSLGCFFSINQIDFSLFFKKYRLLTTCLAIPILVGIVFTYGEINDIYQKFRCIFTLVGSASVIGIVSYFIENDKIHESTFLSNSSFLIFAAHNVFLLGKIISHMSKLYPGTSQLDLIIKYFAAPSITILILLGCYFVMSKLTPKMLAILTGGRY